MLDIFKIMNEIDDSEAISDQSAVRKTRKLSEDYKVSYGRGAKSINFDTLDDAIDHINKGMKDRASETFVLYNNNDEMIWIDRYAERDGHDLGYTVSRHDDKSVQLGDNGVLSVTPKKYDETLKNIILDHIRNKLRKFGLAPKLAKFNYEADNSGDTHIDFDKNIIYVNRDYSTDEIAQKIVADFEANNKPVNEIFGFGKKAKTACRLGIRGNVSHYFDTSKLIRSIREILNRYKAEQIKVHAGVQACDKLNYFAETMGYIIEFVCSEKDYDKIENMIRNLNGYNHATSVAKQDNSPSELNDKLEGMFKFSTSSVTESIDSDSDLLTEDENAPEGESQQSDEGSNGSEGAEITQELKDADYARFAQILNSDGKSKAFYDYLKNHYKMGDDSLGVIKKASASEGKLKCGALLPTQSNISVSKSLGFVSTPGWSEKIINDPLTAFDTPTITYAGKYIIDGHHRWSKVYAIHGPNSEIKVLNFPEISSVSWDDMLKAVQLAIRFLDQDLDLKNKVDNPNMLDDTTGVISAKQYMKDACDEVIAAMKAKGYGDTKEAQARRVGENVIPMAKKGAVQGAAPRDYMPQTDKIDKASKKVPATLTKLGVIDMSEEYDDDVTELEERLYDDEAPLGRGELYPSGTRTKADYGRTDDVPGWWFQQGGTVDEWRKRMGTKK